MAAPLGEFTDRNIQAPPEDQASSHPEATAPLLKEKILKEAEGLKEERRLLKVRVQKAEDHKDKVSESVYRKIKAEYQEKFDETTRHFLQLKVEIDKELIDLAKKQSTLDRQMMMHKQALEEAKFRHITGEYNDAKFREIETKEALDSERLEKTVESFAAAMKRYQKLFEGEELPAEPIPPAEPPKKQASKKEVKEVKEEKEESDFLYLAEEEESFEEELQEPTSSESLPAAVKPKAAPAKSAVPTLVQMDGGQMVHEYPLESVITIGRSPSNTIVLSESRVSRKHTIIEKRGAGFVVIDLDSSNGTFLNGKKIKESALNPGDEVKVGGVQFVFRV
ncbi:MAG: FHA domain-containing protein [Deltaproteobacteria bacterium]|nr:FHA domain-containing protein [Deltaproteobacteria bacterium]